MTQSLIGVLGMTLCYFYAVSQVGVSMAVALLYTAPVFSLVLAKLILGEQISVKSALLAIVAVIGVACLMAGDKFSLNMGVVVGLLSGLCYSLYGILGKKAMSFNHSTQMVFFSSVAFSAIALLFLPLRRKLQDSIDRRFYRRKYDAEQALGAFTARCRDETEVEALVEELRHILQQTMQPAGLTIWLKAHEEESKWDTQM